MSAGTRRIIQELRRIARRPNGGAVLAALFARLDNERMTAYAETGNGSARLVAFHDAVVDADDTLQAVEAALEDDDPDEAKKLLQLGRESLADRITELKELL